ncbi:MAG: OmpH family outer membrane protein [Deltaproteobacteria bacterium]|nr:OmpH family outer membrane protein [Deltaproteobacteria bacterium]
MNLVRYALASALALSLLLLSSAASAQMKFAVVDVQRAVMESEDGLRAQATLKKLFDKRQQELDAKQNALQQARDDIEKQSKVLSKEALARRTEEWQRAMVELQGTFVEFNKELQKKQGELTQPILNKVISMLRQLAAQDGYDAIFEKNAVPYARSDLDITDKTIQLYNAGTPKAEPPKDDKKAPAAKPPAAKPPAAKPPAAK